MEQVKILCEQLLFRWFRLILSVIKCFQPEVRQIEMVRRGDVPEYAVSHSHPTQSFCGPRNSQS